MEVVKYKDSGVAWIGNIPEHWRVSAIKRTTYIKGRIGWQGLTSEEYQSEGKYLLVTGTDFENGKIKWEGCWYVAEERYGEDPYIQLANNDVLITKDGTIGKIALVENMPTEATLNSGVFVTRPYRNEYFPQFMFWVLNSDLFPEFIEYSKVGTTIAHLYQKTFERFSYPLPPLDEQRCIVAFLDKTCAAIDTAIDKKQKQLETLDALRKSIIHKAVSRGLDDSVELKESGIEWAPLKPAHWKTCRVKDILDFFNTVRIPLSADIRGLMTDRIYDYYGASGVIDKVEDYLFDGTYILIAEDGANLLARNSPLAFFVTGKFWVNNHAHILKPRFDNIRYFVYLLESLDYSLCLTGAAQPKLTKENLGKYKIIVPSKTEQDLITDYLDTKTAELKGLNENIENQITALQQYRKSLIHECVTGKRRITDEDMRVVQQY